MGALLNLSLLRQLYVVVKSEAAVYNHYDKAKLIFGLPRSSFGGNPFPCLLTNFVSSFHI